MAEQVTMVTYDSKFKTSWNILLAVIVVAVTPHLSYRLTFGYNSPDGWYWFLIAAYWLDIVLGFSVSVKSKLRILSSRKEIADFYLRRWFVIDVIAAIPYECIIPQVALGGVPAPVLTTVRLLFLLKLAKIPAILTQVEENLYLNPLSIRLIDFLFFFSNAVHYMALGWILIGASESSRPFLDQYLRSLYWCITTVATIGYGDYVPNHDSNVQIVYTIIVQIFGVGMYGYVIGNMSVIISNIDRAKTAFRTKMEEINSFLRVNNVPRDLQKRVRDYYSYMWETRKDVSSAAIIRELPHSCAIDVMLFLNRDIVEKVSFFKSAGEILVKEIIELLTPEVCLPGDMIIRQGEHGDCMFFLSSGTVEVLVNGEAVATLHEGSPFGEAALLSNETRNASVRALSYCDVYRLSKKDFDVFRTRYPEFHVEMQKVTDERAPGGKKSE